MTAQSTTDRFNPDLSTEATDGSLGKFYERAAAHRVDLENAPESRSFLRSALAWHGSVTPVVLPRVAGVFIYSSVVCLLLRLYPTLGMPITPFEYSGAVLGLLLVLRVNAGHDRWWEARKLWGSIVNQSRNLAIAVKSYAPAQESALVQDTLRWISVWPYTMKESLRKSKLLDEVRLKLGVENFRAIERAQHMPIMVAMEIASRLNELLTKGMNNFAFQRAETERSQLIDAIGACERIRNTRMPLALAIKTRRFILLFLGLLPLALFERVGWFCPAVAALTSYPLFSLDEIGAELQNPFSPRNLSHLPLDEICKNIEKNIDAIA